MRQLLGLLILNTAMFGHAAEFSDGVGATWSLSTTSGNCVLAQEVGDYGEARFMGVKGQPLRFEVLGHRDLFAPGPVDLLRVAPPWHRDFPNTDVVAQIPHRSGGAVRATDPVATQILMNLYEGFDAHLARTGWYAPGTAVAVEISSVNFRPLYEHFIDCFRGSSAGSWADMERTRVTFETDIAVLGREAKALLKNVAAYVLLDPQVTRIFVDGHTDSSGMQRKNQPLSKRRAESVADFLRSEGIRKELLVIRYHGASYPVENNQSPGGRSRNRRTTVRLARDWTAER
ncbi:MAG: OmpA family protein [Gammaproteobacteria bacterium]|nr:OmpA family protein [Gammaproteobacteria bacterium]